MLRPRKPYKVLVVDDSAVVRQAMQKILDADPDLQVIAVAADPYVAAEKIRKQVPDVITLDVEMPRMDGITFLRRLMAQRPVPVVMCSSLVSPNSETLSLALEAGAVDIVCKPELGVKDFFEDACTVIRDAVKAAAQARLSVRPRALIEKKLTADAVLAAPGPRAMARTTEKVVAIGASTGGTEALRLVLERLPQNCPPIVIVQHMPEAFTSAFAQRLDSLCAVTVKEAKSGDRMLRGQVLIAPGNKHCVLTRSGASYGVDVIEGPLVSRHRPSVDVLFRSVARVAGKNAVGVIMTGMGDDGARGLLEMRESGARTVGQDEESSVVYGMPKEAFKRGGVEEQMALDRIPEAVMRLSAG
ncbi:protein-glutamate methylesterase/protein-glutamine glutaminase [Chachezhania antarctica]|uniref:protein-glutamate methylesterase/protein-glutamine glutaminase n=1 Tax=Chachezhania antarctica TaxID=2340860 RepID=UPI000EAFCDAB|nr:chemotaxis response regulator protein-glutamate methylesterase [Chachezhania antarctica]|tara:strand:+ start:5705 stop:6778 length:1074 start_codon:yes stop_codon:yes gene_type:complete